MSLQPGTSSPMDDKTRGELHYEPRRCAFLNRDVLAILAQQSDGSWRVVNCREKDEACFKLNCAFTASDGEWPYPDHP